MTYAGLLIKQISPTLWAVYRRKDNAELGTVRRDDRREWYACHRSPVEVRGPYRTRLAAAWGLQ